MNRLAEILKRVGEIEAEVRKGNVDEVLSKELDQLLEEKRSIEGKQKSLESKFNEARAIKVATEEVDVRASEVYHRAWLKDLQGKALSEEEKRAVTSATGSGAAAIPTTTYQKIQDALVQESILFPRVQKMYVKGNLSIPLEDSTSAAAWVAEGAGANDGTDKLKSVTFQAYDLIKNQDITAQMANMPIADFEAWLVRVFARKMAQALDAAIINGTGSLNNQPEGILTSLNWTDAANATKITKGAAWTVDNILTFVGSLPTVYAQNSEIYVNRKTLFNKVNAIKKATGSNEPIFVVNPEEGSIGKLLGVRVVIFDFMPDNVLLYGDMSAYLYNFNKEVEIAKDTSVGFKSAKTSYRAHALVDGKTVRPDAFVKLYESLT